MARKDFYNIKDLGELPSEVEYKRPDEGYQPNPKQAQKQRKTGPRWLVVGLVLALVVVVGVTALLAERHTPGKPKAKSLTVLPSQSSSTVSSTNQYVSNGSDLNLTFSYPTNWSVTPASGDNTSDQTISVTSPLTTTTEASGASVTGKVVVSVRPGTATPVELNSNNPLAAAASTQIAYSAPTVDQYQYPYITFIHFSNGLNVSGDFEEAIITGTTQFSQSEQVLAEDLSGLDPIISASFTKCINQTCTASGAAPLSINSSTWTNSALFQQTLAIFESFKLN